MDDSFPAQSKKVYDRLTSVTSRIIYFLQELKKSEEHCQCDALALSNQRIFGWLDEIFYHK